MAPLKLAAIIVTSSLIGLSACGGGGGSGGDSPDPRSSTPIPTNAGGIWQGSTFNDQAGLTFETVGVITENNGEARFVNEQGQQFIISGFSGTDGNLSATVTAFAALGTAFLDGNTVTTGTLTGTVVERDSIEASWSLNTGDTGSVTMAYSDVYERGSDIASLVGSWQDSNGATYSIDERGNLSGQDALGCVIDGNVSIIDAAYNVYQLAFGVSSCPGANGNYTGLGVLTDATGTNDTFIVQADNGQVIFTATIAAIHSPPVDSIAPIITLLGEDPQIVEVGSVYSERGARASDDVDGNLSDLIVIDASAVDTSVPGEYTVTYDVTDFAGNAAVTVTRTVIVRDTTPPVITLVGANPQSILFGNAYSELGATAFDNVDGDISGAIEIDAGSVDTSSVGTYLVTYNVTDSSGNPAASVTRQVIVQSPVDASPPVISLIGDNPQIMSVGDPYVEQGATAFDNVDGDLTAAIKVDSSAADTSTPGEYAVTYNVSDSSGNAAATVIRTVVVRDTTPPVVTLLGDDPQIVEAGDSYVDAGATASDNVDGDLSNALVVDVSAVNTSVLGEYTVSYEASDAAGNTGSATRTVIVQDTTPPVIVLVGDNPQVIVAGDPYTELGATASDTVDGNLTASIIIDASSVDTNLAGDYTVSYNVSDAASNAAETITRIVRVKNASPPSVPALSIEGYIKTLIFSWDDDDKVDFYRLYVSSNAQAEWTQVGDDIPATETTIRLEISAHLFDFESTEYELEACNRIGCTRSPTATVEDLDESTIGYFKAFDGTVSEDRFRFGSPLALSGSGKVMAIGDRNRDVYIYRSVEGLWREDAVMSADDSLALTSIALSRSGNTLAIGRGDQTMIFSRENDAYVPTAEFDVSGSMDMSADGRNLAIGVGSHAENTGAVYVFQLQGGTWRQTAFLMASNADAGDQFGNAVSLSADGSVLAVGAPYEQSTSSGINGDQDDNSSFGEGAAYVFEYRDSEWVQTTYIKSTDGTKGLAWYDINDFAYVVELSGDGRTLAVGNPTFTLPGNGDVHVYRMESTQWMLDNVFYVHDLCFSDGSGCSALGEAIGLSADGNTLALGCKDCDPLIPYDAREFEDFGVAYIYSRESGEWNANPRQLLAPNWLVEHDWCDFTNNWAYCGNDFGKTIAVSEDGKTLAVGSNDPSAATGIGGDWDDNSLRYAGSVFLY